MSTTMRSLCFVFAIFFLLCILSSASFQNDQQSLLAFKDLITTDPFNSTADWTPALPFCNWTGLTCSRRHPLRVVALNLSVTSLGGSISPSLGNLSFLRTLDLSGNALHAHIPIQLGCLFRLRELWLHKNQLDGNIPSQLSNCRKLTVLALSYNNLNGNIPQQLGFLSHLQQLYLGRNNLTDGIWYVETMNLDGETNLKVNRSLEVTLPLDEDNEFKDFRATVRCEDPNPNLYSFVGNFEFERQVYPLGPDQVLLRD